MLYFVSTQLSLCYLLFAFLAAIGVLQIIAARYHLAGIAFLDYAEHPRRGYALGTMLILAGALIYFVSQWSLIFTPGPAGAELTILFGAAAVAALFVTLALASILHAGRARGPQADLPDGRAVTLGPSAGHLYLPAEPAAPLPAVCLFPGLGVPKGSLQQLAHDLLEQHMAVLVVEPDEQAYDYPTALAILPAAVTLLSKLTEVDPQRIGVAGHDLGADLVIRSASVDPQIKAAVALAPVLTPPAVGLDLLHEMSYPQALHWARNRRREALRSQLTALEYGAKIVQRNGEALGQRSALWVSGSEDRLVVAAPAGMWAGERFVVDDAGHLNIVDNPQAINRVVNWLKEHL